MAQNLGAVAEKFSKFFSRLVNDAVIWNYINNPFFALTNSTLQGKFNATERFAATGWHIHKVNFRILAAFSKSLVLQCRASLLQLGQGLE